LYWPQSKFAFGVLRPDTLAAIYEQYLAERVTIDANRGVTLVEKPELTHAGGVVRTPPFVVEALLNQALSPALANGISEGLSVLDLACGSGIFLVAALTRLATVCEMQGAEPGLELRAGLAARHIFGVDIDGEAVEVTKLSLLLAILGDEPVDVATARDVLPDLGTNVITGNSVVDADFDALRPAVAAVAERRAAVAPLDLTQAFPEVHQAGGFDVIVGNPPYQRIQTLSEYMPDQLAYFQDARSRFKSSLSHNFDVYLLFVERALELVRVDGRVGLIIPHRFANTLAGASVRESLGPRLVRLVHFGVEQVFEGRMTYTALVCAGAATPEPGIFELVENLGDWIGGAAGEEVEIPRSELGRDIWPIPRSGQARVFAKMAAAKAARLGDVADIFVGVQTSADEVLFITPRQQQPDAAYVEFNDRAGRRWRIERGVCRPGLKDRILVPYDFNPVADRLAIFPYDIDPPAGTHTRSRAQILSPPVMRERYPLAMDYLEAHEAELRSRNVSPNPGDAFYAYGRSQSLTKLDAPKVVVRVLSRTPIYAVDHRGLVVAGGGDGGPYYLLRPRAGSPVSLQTLVAVMSHPAVDAFIRSRGRTYRGGYVSHRRAFMLDVPLPRLDDPVESS
jgi:methylase of polypeptide subunit release factors